MYNNFKRYFLNISLDTIVPIHHATSSNCSSYEKVNGVQEFQFDSKRLINYYLKINLYL